MARQSSSGQQQQILFLQQQVSSLQQQVSSLQQQVSSLQQQVSSLQQQKVPYQQQKKEEVEKQENEVKLLKEEKLKLEEDMALKNNIRANTSAGIIVMVLTVIAGSLVAGAFTNHLEPVYMFLVNVHHLEYQVAFAWFYPHFCELMNDFGVGVSATQTNFDTCLILADIFFLFAAVADILETSFLGAYQRQDQK